MGTRGGGELLCAQLDSLLIVDVPQEEQVDRVEGGISDTGTGVESNQPTVGPTVDDVVGCQVAVQQHHRCVSALGEPQTEGASALVQLDGDDLAQVRMPGLQLQRVVEELSYAVAHTWIEGRRDAARV